MANILIVDDSIVMRKNLATILMKDGHTIVGEASNGRQAIIQFEELQPDLVTMDISMPIMSGVEAVEAIIQKYPEAKIVMISAVNQKKMVFNAINSGAKHYIIKPIEVKKVLSVIHEVLENTYLDLEMSDDVEEKVNVQGFEIQNTEGRFVIKFNPCLDFTDHNLLEMAIRGILFIKPLKVELNFDNIDDVDIDILQPILQLRDEVEKNGGVVTYSARSEAMDSKLVR